MVPAETPGKVLALRVGLWELLIVLAALIFVRKEVYLAGQFKSMFLHWQEYVLLGLMFADGALRGFGEVQGKGHFLSPFRKRSMCYWLPITLFLFVSCSSLCDKMNWACIRQEWWRDTGLLIVILGVALSAWEQRTRPQQLEAEMVPRTFTDSSEPKSGTTGGALETAAKAELCLTGQNPKSSSEPARGNGTHYAEIKVEGPWNLLRYPDRSSILLELIGISFVLSAWMPLLTLPGLIVAFKWELADVEAFRISQFGKKYLNYKEKTWFLIPYIY